MFGTHALDKKYFRIRVRREIMFSSFGSSSLEVYGSTNSSALSYIALAVPSTHETRIIVS